jgi:hypothetical protein
MLPENLIGIIQNLVIQPITSNFFVTNCRLKMYLQLRCTLVQYNSVKLLILPIYMVKNEKATNIYTVS